MQESPDSLSKCNSYQSRAVYEYPSEKREQFSQYVPSVIDAERALNVYNEPIYHLRA